ncbi:hypothetical protein PUW24_20515 [Paenibacillus urinalis]|uniref:Uncharacterized protein n=1 Tax=Paenibacillus urinalis TaxID=521520 RepID=A0AAX3MSZ5_9BACL|nr:hypothetical protein [Paenibacillus urinalis]WDH80488.1 hypothetical protein PUW23_13010 [Paenibacillus urinalis]WDH96529.1 hypothetical protein PUW24_20515 [Paenibacillus urinalis]WDI00175.1 hypothetical protein PUW25_12680 [Paenibacillus urinalis]GAK40670.1 hypothetical protein TCA2_3160 [Paenibacillus sp. TCA20]
MEKIKVELESTNVFLRGWNLIHVYDHPTETLIETSEIVEGQEHIPIEVAILAAFLFYRYKFVSRVKDKNLYRLPKLTRTCSDYRLDKYLTEFYSYFIKLTGRLV